MDNLNFPNNSCPAAVNLKFSLFVYSRLEAEKELDFEMTTFLLMDTLGWASNVRWRRIEDGSDGPGGKRLAGYVRLRQNDRRKGNDPQFGHRSSMKRVTVRNVSECRKLSDGQSTAQVLLGHISLQGEFKTEVVFSYFIDTNGGGEKGKRFMSTSLVKRTDLVSSRSHRFMCFDVCLLFSIVGIINGNGYSEYRSKKC